MVFDPAKQVEGGNGAAAGAGEDQAPAGREGGHGPREQVPADAV
jgi:hypothetical protein